MESQTSFDLNSFVKEATDYKSLPLSLVDWQNEYNKRQGLTENNPSSDSDNVLPLHPKTLELELERCKEAIQDARARYTELEAKSRFMSTVLQDPPQSILPEQRIELEGIALELSKRLDGIQEEMISIKQTIAEMNATNEKARQALNDTVDDIIKKTDEIEAQRRELAELEATIKEYAVERTPEEAQACLEQQTIELAEISQKKDAAQDRVAELEWQMEDELQEIQGLEATLRDVQARAQEAVEMSGQRDPDAEKREAWFREMSTLCRSLYGITKVVVDINCIKVDYETADQLVITLDPLDELITDVSVNNDTIAIDDLADLGKGKRVSEVGSTIVVETLARTRKT